MHCKIRLTFTQIGCVHVFPKTWLHKLVPKFVKNILVKNPYIKLYPTTGTEWFEIYLI